jgi:hypothetical protein
LDSTESGALPEASLGWLASPSEKLLSRIWPNGCLNRKKDLFPDRRRIMLLARYGGPTALEISLAFSGSVGKNLRQTTRKAATIGTER